jgi:hypothetical protein
VQFAVRGCSVRDAGEAGQTSARNRTAGGGWTIEGRATVTPGGDIDAALASFEVPGTFRRAQVHSGSLGVKSRSHSRAFAVVDCNRWWGPPW